MDIKQLIAFRAVFDNGSVTQAAKILGVTQPAVSAQLARLEESIGFDLFERVAGRLRPTTHGRQFYAEVIRALSMLERLEQSAQNIRRDQRGRLTIASQPMVSISILPELVTRFAATYPAIAVRMINRTSEEVRSIFEASAVDIGIAELPINVPGIELRRYTVPCVAIVPCHHPLAEKALITPADFAAQPFVTMSPGRLIGHKIKSTFADTQADLHIVAEAEYFSTICMLVSEERGVAIVDCWSAATFGARIVARRFEPLLDYQLGVFHRADQTPSAPVQALLALLDAKLCNPPVLEPAAAGGRRQRDDHGSERPSTPL